MKKVCAWCGAVLSEPEAGSQARDLVSHGICGDCQARLLGDIGQPLVAFVASLPEPVLLLTDDAVIVARSEPTRGWALPVATAAEGRLLGDVFECVHAGLPEGCGRTIHCSGCTIRNSVEDTYRTGRPHHRVPATLRVTSGQDEVALRITTEKMGEHVLLRVDPA